MLHTHRFTALAALCALSLGSSSAFALTSISPTDLSTLSADSINTIIKTVGVAADHRAYAPATALGLVVGIDVGLDVTYFSLPSEFASALATASGQTTSQLPAGLVLPKLNIHKGLPWGIDVGGTFMSLSSGGTKIFSSYGGEVKWAFINSAALPAVAIRGSYSSNTVYFMDTSGLTFDVTASKNLVLIDPYVGLGLQRWSGNINVPAGIPVPSGIALDASGTAFHMYGGLQLKLAILKIVGEARYSTAGLTTFGGKFSIGF
jgi:hypothetical protein